MFAVRRLPSADRPAVNVLPFHSRHQASGRLVLVELERVQNVSKLLFIMECAILQCKRLSHKCTSMWFAHVADTFTFPKRARHMWHTHSTRFLMGTDAVDFYSPIRNHVLYFFSFAHSLVECVVNRCWANIWFQFESINDLVFICRCRWHRTSVKSSWFGIYFISFIQIEMQ